MPNQDSRCSPRTKRSSNGKQTSKTSNASSRQSFSSVSVQASSRALSFSESAYRGNDTENSQIHISAPGYGHESNQQYAADVIAGLDSLGIDVSSALKLSLTDQHGSLRARESSYSASPGSVQFAESAQHTGDVQIPEASHDRDLGDLNQSSRFDSSVIYGRNRDDLNGDLVGIGAQFDH